MTGFLRFTESKADSNLYFKVEGGIPMMLLLYVDDLFLTEKLELIKVARRRLAVKFEMKVLRPGNSQVTTEGDSPQSAFPTSPLTVWNRESVRFTVRLP